MCYQHAHRYFNAQAIGRYYKEEGGGLGRMSQEWQCLEPQAFQAWAGDGVTALLHPALLPPPTAGGAEPLRSVEHQPVPLSFHVIVLRLLRDIEAVKLQLPGQFLLPLKDHQGHLEGAGR